MAGKTETAAMFVHLSISQGFKYLRFATDVTDLYRIHTKKLSCLKSGVEFYMNDILNEFKNLHQF